MTTPLGWSAACPHVVCALAFFPTTLEVNDFLCGVPHRSCAKHCIRCSACDIPTYVVREVTDVDVSIYDATYHNYVARTAYGVHVATLPCNSVIVVLGCRQN